MAGVCVSLLARARKLAAFEGARYATVRTALDRWREHKKNAAFWDEVVGTVRVEGQNEPHAPHVITFQRVVSALWPDLADTIRGKARPHHTGKCTLSLWCQWREAKDRLAELIESIAGSKPDALAAGGTRQPQKRKRKLDPKVVAKRKRREELHKREGQILREWERENWSGGFVDYAQWRNATLPEGWPKLTYEEVKRAVEAARKRLERKGGGRKGRLTNSAP